MSFTTQNLTDAPHFNAPFALNPDGSVEVVSQNSDEDVLACVYNIMSCTQGQKYADPSFGIPSPLFGTIPLNTSAMIAAIQTQEPRATITMVENTIADQQNPGSANVEASLYISQATS